MRIYKVINIKNGLPTVEEARKILIHELDKAIKEHVKYIKIIHGYGSNGLGGAIGEAIRKSLNYRKKEGKISDVLYGEKFSTFNPISQKLIDKYPFLRKDPDYNNDNFGITIAIF